MFETVPRENKLPIYTREGEVNVFALCDFLRLKRQDLANICNIKKDSVRFDDRMPKTMRDLMLNLANLCEIVAQYFGDPIKTETWFKIRNPSLNNKRPIDYILHGRHEELKQILDAKTIP